jgi:hypothetical protein
VQPALRACVACLWAPGCLHGRLAGTAAWEPAPSLLHAPHRPLAPACVHLPACDILYLTALSLDLR